MMRQDLRSLISICRGSCSIAMLALLGCSGGPGRIATPPVDCEDAATAAFELYDLNGDGQLDAGELQSSPALVDAMPTYDTDRDRSLSLAELVRGIQSWAERGIGVTPVSFNVKFNGRPLTGALIKLTPVEFLDDAIRPASGMSDENGYGSLHMAAEDLPANVPKHLPVMQPGLYSVEITHPSIEIPDRYNSETILGLEAGIAGQNPSGVVWNLRSKKK